MPIFVIHEEEPNSPTQLSTQGSDKGFNSQKNGGDSNNNDLKKAKNH